MSFTVPAQSSPIKSIQRGVATSAGNVTISSVDISKTMVTSFSTGSSGTVSASGTITGTLSPSGGNVSGIGVKITGAANSINDAGSYPSYSGTRTLSGGTTDLTSAVNGAYLSNSTTLVVTGPCRWEVVEFN